MPPKQKAAAAKKAQPPPTPSAPAAAPAAPASNGNTAAHVIAIVRATALMALAAAASTVSQLTLSPVYGGIPASIWHKKVVIFIVMAAVINKDPIRRYMPGTKALIPLLAFYAPPIQSTLFQYSDKLGPDYGPVVTEALTVYPFLFLSLIAAIGLVETLNFSPALRRGVPGMAAYATFAAFEKLTEEHLPALMGSNDFFTRSGLSLVVAAGSAIVSPSWLLALALPAAFHTLRLNPHSPFDATTEVLKQKLQAQQYTLLDRVESLSGYVSVLESGENQFRLLRCDHSLLGGEWLVTPERQRMGQTQRETIYTVFTMLEAVRLVQTAASETPDAQKSALNIGLGIGTCPTALIAHGINTTIVELDPAVHAMATKHFALPQNHTAVLSDAVPFVADAAASQPASYDYIVHDVFTGGAEPAALFTLDFLNGLKTLLRPDGVIALNYAGDLRLPTTRMVLNTIHAVFPSCRIFRDQLPDKTSTTPADSDDPNAEPAMDFLNMVLFCRPVAEPIEFRKPGRADWLGSIVRKRTLLPGKELEVAFSPDEGAQLLTGETVEVLEKGHKASAVSHWRIMRTVLPDAVWQLW
ncbi:uncharacterized protein K452DRAFT_290224 [Aplosporella prunicola CBS 121167]|uniref:PABS domain-containing protein n=1 Tax=Aplosporella prunicola CBS 121167 TaxID=1176127 RepID=A0A6A6B5J2_9PEZI|nr:uncharacterized protein K452DRAFT_290224 [Aplosporella prunicola CBS 121167]KAF2139126.1 hypothetical protein K452DRAFT_290224 [Aplosporella prunicola CBS 121167]